MVVIKIYPLYVSVFCLANVEVKTFVLVGGSIFYNDAFPLPFESVKLYCVDGEMNNTRITFANPVRPR